LPKFSATFSWETCHPADKQSCVLLTSILSWLTALSALLVLWQWIASRSFPLHQRAPVPNSPSPITLLKPLKGFDAETESCLTSWFRQEQTGPIQLLFGVADPNDPVCPLVRRLISQHPNIPAELRVCPNRIGANGKISTLAQLQPHITGDIVVVSDADVWAPSDYLAQTIDLLRDQTIGLVNSFYQLTARGSLAARWEAIAVNADFWSQVLQSRSIRPIDFALGAVMSFRRTDLEQIGGFAALADFLADDFQLGKKIFAQGKAIALGSIVVQCRTAPLGWSGVWAHQLRWARTIRVCQPIPYFFSILSNATLWPLLWFVTHPTQSVLAGSSALLVVRALTALDQQCRLCQRSLAWSDTPFVWLKDILQAILWALAFAGRTVTWRGQRYRVKANGHLLPAIQPMPHNERNAPR